MTSDEVPFFESIEDHAQHCSKNEWNLAARGAKYDTFGGFSDWMIRYMYLFEKEKYRLGLASKKPNGLLCNVP